MHEKKSVEEKARLNSATYHSQYVIKGATEQRHLPQYVITAQMSNRARQQQSSRRGVGCPAYKSVVFKENDGAGGIG